MASGGFLHNPKESGKEGEHVEAEVFEGFVVLFAIFSGS